MASTAQITANQQNSEKSTGPVTETGKKKAALNSTRHGFTGQVVLLTAEEAEPYRLFNEQFLTDLAPQGAVEQQLARNIIDAYWRVNQISATQSAIYAMGHREYVAQFSDETPEVAAAMARALTFKNNRKELDCLHRYESRLQRQAATDSALLRQIQHANRAHEERLKARAINLHNYFKKQGTTWDPAEFGFVWSIQEIEAKIDRDNVKFAADRSPFSRIAA